MMSQEANDLITRTGPQGPLRQADADVLAAGGAGRRVAGAAAGQGRSNCSARTSCCFATSEGRYGLIDRHCAHRGADLAFGRLENGGLRCAFHGWLFDVDGQCLETPAEPKDSQAVPGHQAALLSRGREERHPLGLSRRRRAAGVSGDRLLRRARQPHLCVQGPDQLQLAAGAGSRHRSGARLVPASLLRGRGYVRPPTASSSAAPPPAATCR